MYAYIETFFAAKHGHGVAVNLSALGYENEIPKSHVAAVSSKTAAACSKAAAAASLLQRANADMKMKYKRASKQRSIRTENGS
jgi:hypothetical protein